MNLLVVEDEQFDADLILGQVRDCGKGRRVNVTVRACERDVYSLLESGAIAGFDGVILDVILNWTTPENVCEGEAPDPFDAGFRICREFQRKNLNIPLLLCSNLAKGDLSAEINSLPDFAEFSPKRFLSSALESFLQKISPPVP